MLFPSSGREYYRQTWPVVLAVAIMCIWTVEAKLVQVSVLFRHGDRAPENHGDEMYPTDPYLHYDFYPEGAGQLTLNGKRREFALGKVLRERYEDFLGEVYTPPDVWGLSSDYDRTKMSLQLVLAALFPPAKIQRWNEKLNWQPIPTNYLRRVVDNVFLADECPAFLREYNKAVNSRETVKKLSPYTDLMKKLTKATGKEMSKPMDFYNLYLTLMAESSMGLQLPEWTNGIFPHGALFDLIVIQYETANSTPLLRRLYAGPYLRIVTTNMKNLRNGTLNDPRKMYLYSGHETNIASLLFALNLYTPQAPEFSSSVILELHEIDNVYYVKILHYLGIPPVINELQMPGCDVLCPLDKFIELTADVIPSDEDLICDKTLTKQYANHKTPAEEDSGAYDLIKAARATEAPST